MITTVVDPDGNLAGWLCYRNMDYVTRFPPCEATVRITWNGAANQHPHWWGPATKP